MAELAEYVSSPYLLLTAFLLWVETVGTVSREIFVSTSLTAPVCWTTISQANQCFEITYLLSSQL